MKSEILSAFFIPGLALGAYLPRQWGDQGLPRYGLNTNGVSIGWLPSDGNTTEGVTSTRYTMKEINHRLGAVSSTYGMYSHITSKIYDGYELLEEYEDIIHSGAVFVASVMPVLEAGFTAITPDVASQIASVMRKFTDQGVLVWLRYGFEMNWYINPAAEPRYHGTPSEFISSFQMVAKAVANNPMVSMFWSPNNLGGGPAETLDEWYPGDDIVDLVGIDCYPQSPNQTFKWCYKDFYDRFSAAKNKPFVIGETGAFGDFKEIWLTELVTQRNEEYPNYISMAWFEYDKEEDFRLVMGSESTLEDTEKILGLE